MKRLSALLLTLAVVLSGLVPAHAAGTQNKIRVGYFSFSGFHDVDESGHYSGYGYDYLQEVAKYTGWEYEYVHATWDECLDMLAKGELDLLGSAQKTPLREEQYEFPDLNSGVSYAVLSVRTDNTDFAYEDFESFEGMTVGLLQHSSRNAQLTTYCAKNNFSIRPLFFKDEDGLREALLTNQVDAIFTSNLRREQDERIVARFAPSPFYFITTKGNTTILGELNRAQDQLKLTNPYFDLRLAQKHYAVGKDDLPVFTRSEREYLQEHPVLRVACDPGWLPISTRSEDGTFSGIVPDVLRRLQEVTGLSFTMVPAATLEEAEQLLAGGEVDFLSSADLEYTPHGERLLLSNSYLTIPNVIVNDPNHNLPVSQTVAVTTDFMHTNNSARLSELTNTLLPYSTTADCLDALLWGEASSAFVNAYAADALRTDRRYARLQISALPGIQDELCFAMPWSADRRLLTILNKFVQYLSAEELQNITLANTVSNRAPTLVDVLYENPLQAVLLVSSVLLVIIALLLYALFLRSRSNRQVNRLMYWDELTDIQNLNYFLPALGKVLSSGQGPQYAVLCADIRRFKDLNSLYGYTHGSLVLRHIADVLRAHCAQDELCARISGDNFVVMFRYEGEEPFLARLKTLNELFNDLPIPSMESVHLCFSTGVYHLRPEDRDASVAVDRANDARKSIKELHKSWYAFYDTSVEEQLNARRKVEAEMEPALASGCFVPYYQAKFDLQSGNIVGAEALVRWHHPEQGLVQPYAFIPIFEHNGFITQLDFFVFESVCRTLRAQMDAGVEPVPISTNFSRVHFSRPGFAQHFSSIAQHYEIPPHLLELEVTESVLEGTPEYLFPSLQTLREEGYLVSMDDFGSGYSSLNLLRDMPVDILKLDKDFLQKGILGGRDLIILDSFVEMAHKLSVTVTCEGVETREQEAFLRALGCDIAQGFLYARPVPLDKFEDRLLRSRGL